MTMTRPLPALRRAVPSLLAAAAMGPVAISAIAAPGAMVVPAAAMLLPGPAHAAGSPETRPVRIDIKVTDAGFEPRQIKVKRRQPTTLAFTRTTERTCITAIDIPDE